MLITTPLVWAKIWPFECNIEFAKAFVSKRYEIITIYVIENFLGTKNPCKNKKKLKKMASFTEFSKWFLEKNQSNNW